MYVKRQAKFHFFIGKKQFFQYHVWKACLFPTGYSWLLFHKITDHMGMRFFLASLFSSVDLCVYFRARNKSLCFDYYNFLIQFEISNPSLKLCSSFSRSLLSLVFCDLIQQNRPRRDGKSTQKNYTKKYLNDPDNQNGVVSHVEPETLECELQWV